ncbi:MAG: OmpA family protein [Planctomycetota bacterium]
MKIDTRTCFRPLPPIRLSALVLGTAALLLGSSCVSQARYDEAMAELAFYQRGLQDLESATAPIEAENALLKKKLAAYEDAATLPSAYTAGIDERLAELRRIAEGFGGAPGDVTVLQVEGGYGLRLNDAVLFDSGRAEVLPEGREIIKRLAQEIASHPYARLWVRGHTDTDPVKRPETVDRFPYGNIQLSAARAIEVAVLLRQEPGIDAAKIVVAGFGPSLPVAANDTADNKRKNRRVEIFVIEDEAAAGGR